MIYFLLLILGGFGSFFFSSCFRYEVSLFNVFLISRGRIVLL